MLNDNSIYQKTPSSWLRAMPSKHNMLINLAKIASTEKELWKSFLKAEKESRVGIFDIKKQIAIRAELKKRGTGLIRHYPFIQILAFLSAIAAPPTTGALQFMVFITYATSIFYAIYSRDKFIREYSKMEVGQANIVSWAFGIDQISLKTFKLFEKFIETGKKLDPKTLDSIIKLVKASQDYESTNYGYNEHLHKLFVATIFSLPISVPLFSYKYQSEILLYWSKFITAAESNTVAGTILLGTLMFMAIPISMLLYSFAYGDKAAARRKKRYLLLLNALKESYATK